MSAVSLPCDYAVLHTCVLGQDVTDSCLDAETRSAKMFSKKTYETGVVIVRCPGCQGDHLIADRLGWFGEPGSIEDYLKQQGEGGHSFSTQEHIAAAVHPECPSAYNTLQCLLVALHAQSEQ